MSFFNQILIPATNAGTSTHGVTSTQQRSTAETIPTRWCRQIREYELASFRGDHRGKVTLPEPMPVSSPRSLGVGDCRGC